MINRDLTAPCGLYCGVCGIYYASVNNDEDLKQKIAKVYRETADKISCGGCRSDNVYWYCKVCAIKTCAIDRGYEGCHQCAAFPCEKVESFPVPEGKKHILRAVPLWREKGTEEWAENEIKLFSCDECGNQLFRGAKKCRACGNIKEQSV